MNNKRKKLRLVIGDAISPATTFIRPNSFAGISIFSEFNLDNNFKPYAGTIALETIIESPTKAELVRNGRIVKEWDLLPGPVNFYDLYSLGEDQLILRDAYGRERFLDLPSLFANNVLLNKGVHEFSYNLGMIRENFDQHYNDYNDPFVVGLHRYGISRNITTGLTLSAKKNFAVAEPILGFRFNGNNMTELQGAYKKEEGESAFAAAMKHTYKKHLFSCFFSLQYYSRSFIVDTSLLTRMLANIRADLFFHRWGGISLSIFSREYWSDDIDRSTMGVLRYNKRLNNYLTMLIGAQYQLEGKGQDNQVFLELTYVPRNSRTRGYLDSLSYRYKDSDEAGRSQQISMRKSADYSKGFGYNIDIKQDSNSEKSIGIRLEHRNEVSILSASMFHYANGSDQGMLGVAGSIGILDTGFYFGRPVTDAFSVVEVDGVDGLPIYHNNRLYGTVGKGESLLISDLSSYRVNEISIHPNDLPIDHNIVEEVQYIVTKNRGGAQISFRVEKFTAIEGNVYLVSEDGQELSLNALPIEIEIGGKIRSSFIGLNGYFYLENVPIGKHKIRVLRSEGDCEALLDVKESKKLVNNLGKMPCSPSQIIPNK